jgi:hypothetical protein
MGEKGTTFCRWLRIGNPSKQEQELFNIFSHSLREIEFLELSFSFAHQSGPVPQTLVPQGPSFSPGSPLR